MKANCWCGEQVEFGVGEWVKFKGVEGMSEINGVEVKVSFAFVRLYFRNADHSLFQVLDTRMYNFTIDIDTTKFGRYLPPCCFFRFRN